MSLVLSPQYLLWEVCHCLIRLTKFSNVGSSYLTRGMHRDFIYCLLVLSPTSQLIYVFLPLILLYSSPSFASGNEVFINLWGERAVQFNGQNIHSMGQTAPAVAIFVGTTVHIYEGWLLVKLARV